MVFDNTTNTLWVAARAALYKSVNGGSTFTTIVSGGGGSNGCMDVEIAYTSPTTIYATFGQLNQSQIWRSTDAASSWTDISGDLTGDGTGSSGAKISTVIVANGNSNVIYAGCTNGTVQVTTNAGSSWSDISSGLPNLYCTRMATDPNNPATAFATFSGYFSGQKVYKTTNSGSNWSNISGDLPNLPVSCIVVNPNNVNELAVGTDLGVFATTNGGGNWHRRNNGMANVSVTDLDYRSSDGKLFAATHGRGMFSTPFADVTFVDDEIETPSDFALKQNYPNPFNPSTKIGFRISNLPAGRQGLVFVSLKVYDALGKEIAVLVNEDKPVGSYEVEFSSGLIHQSAGGGNGGSLTSGIYFYKLQTDNFVETKKMILMK
jgi:hypothetical protein